MDRTIFYKQFSVEDEDENNIQEVDFLYNSLSNFEMNYEPIYYTVEEGDIYRPDVISFNCYQTVNYWWIIAFVNDIQNIFDDLTVGKLLVVPSLFDIYDFYKKNKVLS